MTGTVNITAVEPNIDSTGNRLDKPANLFNLSQPIRMTLKADAEWLRDELQPILGIRLSDGPKFDSEAGFGNKGSYMFRTHGHEGVVTVCFEDTQEMYGFYDKLKTKEVNVDGVDARAAKEQARRVLALRDQIKAFGKGATVGAG